MPQHIQPQPVRYHTKMGVRSGLLVGAGRLYLHVIFMDVDKLTITNIAKSEERHFGVPKLRGKPYPTAKAVNHFKRLVNTYGATKRAKRIIRGL